MLDNIQLQEENVTKNGNKREKNYIYTVTEIIHSCPQKGRKSRGGVSRDQKTMISE